jgi:hypothetical protein
MQTLAWPDSIEEGFMLFVQEIWSFMRARKKFWLLPLLAMLLSVGGLMLLAQSSAIAPFIYSLF